MAGAIRGGQEPTGSSRVRRVSEPPGEDISWVRPEGVRDRKGVVGVTFMPFHFPWRAEIRGRKTMRLGPWVRIQ